MSKRAYEMIAAGLADAAAYVNGTADRRAYRVHAPESIDVKRIRAGLGLSQTAFAARFGFSAGAVRDWEQGRKRPEASARVLLKVIEKEPEAVSRALEQA